MVKLLFFAALREQLGHSELQLCLTAPLPLQQLLQQLANQGGHWSVLNQPQWLCARNQQLCALTTHIANGDEVAVFPAVTGG